MITVKFFAALRDITGEREHKMELKRSEATVAEVLGSLSVRYGKGFRDYIFDTKNRKSIRSQISIILNGQNLRNPESLEARITDGDTIAILPPISGG